MLLNKLSFCVYVIVYVIDTVSGQPGTICKSYNDVTKVKTCSGQTVIVENQFGGNGGDGCMKNPQLDDIIEGAVQKSLLPLKEQVNTLEVALMQLGNTLMSISDERNLCDSNPCENNGRCINGDATYTCECADEYEGDRCSRRNFCHSNPCANNGRCINGDATYTCECADEYEGDRCSRSVCMNGTVHSGICIKLAYTSGEAVVFDKAKEICRNFSSDLVEITSREMYDKVYNYVQSHWVGYTNRRWPSCYFWVNSTFETTNNTLGLITLSNGTKTPPNMPWFPTYPHIDGYVTYTNLGVTVAKSGVETENIGLYNSPPDFPAAPVCAYEI